MSKIVQEFLDNIRNGDSLSDQLNRTAVARSRAIYANRNVRMRHIRAMGFDMDYTLADYDKEAFESLAFQITIEKLIHGKNYPEEIRRISYQPGIMIRGLIVDKQTGNLLKATGFEYVLRAFHGRRKLPRDERKALYASQKMRLTSDRFASVDTMFSLPEVYLYSELVDFFDQAAGSVARPLRAVPDREAPLPSPDRFPWLIKKDGGVDYGRLFEDIRDMLDQAHADNSLKSIVKEDLPRYIRKDAKLAPTLHQLRVNGKKLFLLTNSEWSYTDTVMSYLLDGELPEMPDWRDYFDVIIADAKKPGFFSGRAPFLEIKNASSDTAVETDDQTFDSNSIYTRGNFRDFERMAGVRGDQILYVGDHIYGDLIRSKKTSMWRTCMVVSELEEELAKTETLAGKTDKLEKLEKERGILDLKQNLTLERLTKLKEFKLQNAGLLTRDDLGAIDAEITHAMDYLGKINSNLTDILVKINKLEDTVDSSFNPLWGQLFRDGAENTRFAEQIRDYACLYTSRVSNFSGYSPTHYFLTPKDMMPHDLRS